MTRAPSQNPTLSAALRRVTTVLIFAIPLASVAAIVVLAPQDWPRIGAMPVPVEWSSAALIALAVGALPLAALVFALIQVRHVFDRFSRGAALTFETARALRLAGIGILAMAVLRVGIVPLQSILLTWSNGPGQRMLSLSLDSASLIAALFGALLVALGVAIAEAAALADENRSFV